MRNLRLCLLTMCAAALMCGSVAAMSTTVKVTAVRTGSNTKFKVYVCVCMSGAEVID